VTTCGIESLDLSFSIREYLSESSQISLKQLLNFQVTHEQPAEVITATINAASSKVGRDREGRIDLRNWNGIDVLHGAKQTTRTQIEQKRQKLS
jgi:hypothetical protein